jgi:hypothetical protein
METQHKSKRKALHRGKQWLNMCWSFSFVKQRDKNWVLRGGCLCQRLAMGFLLSSIQKWSNFLRERLSLFVLFYKAWHSSPPFFLSQTMANRFHRVPTNIHIPWRSAFFFFFFSFFFGMKQYGRQQIRPLRPHEVKTVSQNEKCFEGFWKVAHENLLGMAYKYHA